jgi:hypothetical protein
LEVQAQSLRTLMDDSTRCPSIVIRNTTRGSTHHDLNTRIVTTSKIGLLWASSGAACTKLSLRKPGSSGSYIVNIIDVTSFTARYLGCKNVVAIIPVLVESKSLKPVPGVHVRINCNTQWTQPESPTVSRA